MPTNRLRKFLVSLLSPLLLLPTWAVAANPPQEPTAFTAALRQTPLGSDPARAYFLVNLLRAAEAPAPEVEGLRRELLHTYVARIASPAAAPAASAPKPGVWGTVMHYLPSLARTPPDTVAAAISRGQARAGVLEAPFRADWQAALNQGLALHWQDEAVRLPYFTSVWRDLRPVAPGAWAAQTANGQVRLMLALRLANRSTLALPIYHPDVVWGGEPGSGRGGLVFACSWDRPQQDLSVMQANEVPLLQPGTESEPLACEAQPTGAWWRAQLPALMAAAQAGGAQPLLVLHDLDDATRLYHLELALGSLGPQAEDWGRRLQLARHEKARQWVPGQHALEPPVSARWASVPHQGWTSSSERLAQFLGATVLGLALFAAGRAMLRAGVPKGGVTAATLLVGVGLLLAVTATLGRGGSGYGHPFYVGLGLWSVYFGPMLLGVLALHGLDQLLDEEQLDWWDTVAHGWRRMLDLSSPTSRAEFWGFVAHAFWLWALARVCVAPLDRWVGAVLLVPLLTLTLRRLRSMTGRELVALVVSVVCLVLLALA